MGERSLDLDLLRSFLAVVRSGSFTKAAAEVHLTQSAVSRQMRDLERALGSALFERFGRGVNLTDAGQALVAHAQRILLQASDTLQAIGEIEEGVTGELRIGATITAANYFLPEVLAAYRKKHPRVRLTLGPASTAKLVDQVQRNEIDIALAGQVPLSRDLKVWGLVQDEIVMFAPGGHTLAGRRTVSAQTIAQQDLILREPVSDTRKAVDLWAQTAGVALQPLMDMW